MIEPLNFDEFLLFRGEDKLIKLREILVNKDINTNQIKILEPYHQHFLRVFEEYLVYGGYPEAVLSGNSQLKIEKLDSIARSYIQKDIREIDFIHVINTKYSLYEVKSGKSTKIPRTVLEFEKKYHEKLDISQRYVVNQSVYQQKGKVGFIPAYLL